MLEPGSVRNGALLLACALACGVACAQPAVQSAAAASAAERAQKESDRTMYWIRVLATTPAPVKAAPAPVPKPVVAAKPAAEAREKDSASPARTPGTASNGAPATASVAVGRTTSPAQAPAGDAPEPSALSSRGADSIATAAPAVQATPLPDTASTPAAEPDRGLVQVKSVQPEFPTNVVERLKKGHVEVRFEVEPGGSVLDATVVQSSSPRLNIAATEAVKQWRFKPSSAYHTALVDLVFDIDKWK